MTTDAPLVSFVMTAYRHEDYVEEAMRSILAQEGGYDLELIVIDDASPDGTAQAIENFLGRVRDPRVRFSRNPRNLGAAASIDLGFAQARGRYIARCDADDRWRPNFLNETVPILQSRPEVGLVYGDIAMIGPAGEINSPGGNLRRGKREPQGRELVPLLWDNFVCAPSVLARREAWQGVLPWPERFKTALGDWYLTLRMAQEWDFYCVDKVIADYRVHSQGMHVAFILDGSGERNTRTILDEIMPSLGDDGLARRIRAHHLVRIGLGQLGHGKYGDARRLLGEAIRLRPALLLRAEVLRHGLALLAGYENYLVAKRLFKGLRIKR